MPDYRIQLQCPPAQTVVSRYWRLPYPQLTPAQEFGHEVSITADCNAVVTDCVWRVFAGDDVYAVRQDDVYDFVKLGRDGRFFVGGGLRNQDHYAWGQPVLAPASGKVLFVQEGLPDFHYPLQNGPTLFVDQGLPVQFSHCLMTGDRVEQRAILAGAIVNPLPASGAA